jgi:hypothetical protein
MNPTHGEHEPEMLWDHAGGMDCLHCAKEIPDAFMAAWEATPQSKSGRFNCPACGADHVRRDIGRTPNGKPLYTFRLWGHPTSVRKKKEDRGKS